MPAPVSVLLFDLGGVLIDVAGVEGLAPLLPAPIEAEALQARWQACQSVLDYGTGLLTTDEFVARFIHEWHLPVTAPAFLDAWQASVRGWLPGAASLLDELRPRFRLAALSNSNAAHWDRLAALGVLDAFDLAVGSHQLGLRKPTPAIFDETLARLGAPASTVLFFDDSQANVEAARARGMQAAHVDGPAAVRRHLAGRQESRR